MNRHVSCLLSAALLLVVGQLSAAPPDRAQVRDSLRRATTFMVDVVADHGGFAWVSSADGVHSNGEGLCGPDRVWVQPPGSPAVGLAFLTAYAATKDPIHLKAAQGVGEALIQGQLRSGGWGYGIEFDPEARKSIPYRVGPNGGPEKIAATPNPGGWDVWRSRKHQTNKTLIDDDTTPAAIRFMVSLDRALNFKDRRVHESAVYALASTAGAQYPIGAWGHNYDRFPQQPPSKTHYPILDATYPDTWSRVSTNDFHGCYMINDRITMNMIETMLLAAEVYEDDFYLESAKHGGYFLLRAQLPAPQPAWAQQYDRHMKPVWDRKFEPPAITASESQDVCWTLLKLYEATKDKRFADAVPPAVVYLKTCLRPDGKLARFYELKTNKPLYFDKQYKLTYDDRSVPDHYGFVWESELDEIQNEYYRVTNTRRVNPVPNDLSAKVEQVLAQQQTNGAWLTPGFVRDLNGKKVVPQEGVVDSQVFIDNVAILADYLR